MKLPKAVCNISCSQL